MLRGWCRGRRKSRNDLGEKQRETSDVTKVTAQVALGCPDLKDVDRDAEVAVTRGGVHREHHLVTANDDKAQG